MSVSSHPFPMPEVGVVRLSDLHPAEYNPRTMSDDALDGLTRSLARFGYVDLLVVNKRGNRIVGGHQRFKVLQASGVESCPAVLVDLPEAEEKLLNVTLNNSAIQGEWSDALIPLLDSLREEIADDELVVDLRLDALREELASLDAETADLEGPVERPIIEDEVPEPPADPVTQPGDLWVLGPHRLVCGDAADESTLERALKRTPGRSRLHRPAVERRNRSDLKSKTPSARWPSERLAPSGGVCALPRWICQSDGVGARG